MKLSYKFLTIVAVAFLFLNTNALAEEEIEKAELRSDYLYVSPKIGMHVPLMKINEESFSTVAFGWDLAIGYIGKTGTGIEFSIGNYALNTDTKDLILKNNAKMDVHFIPVLLQAKKIWIFKNSEFYFGAGGGIYIIYLDADYGNAIKIESQKGCLGGHVLSGMNYNLPNNFYIGFEGRFSIMSEAKFTGPWSESYAGFPIAKLNLTGLTANATFGYRF